MKTESKHPLIYFGWIIRKGANGKLQAYHAKSDTFLNPLYSTWEGLKLVIDGMKDEFIIY